MLTTIERAVERGVWDVIVIGGGPAGSQAALGAATEGKSVLLVEGGVIGGQIGQTPHLENLAGHTYGVTGPSLARAFEEQAGRFGVRWLQCWATGVRRCAVGLLHVSVSTGAEVTGRAVILALGLRFRKLGVRGEDHATVMVGPADTNTFDAQDREVLVVGGGNSAGQAIVRLSQQGARWVHVVAHGTLSTSDYLTQRIRRSPNVRVWEGCNLAEVFGRDHERCWAILKNNSGPTRLDVCRVYVCIGMEANTDWLPPEIERDERGLVKTANLQTTLPGVFAIGDVRSGAINRVAVAIGEGGAVMPPLWEYLREAPVMECSL